MKATYLLILLVLLAGCAEDKPPIERGKTIDGIVILEFSPEKQTLRGGESTNLLLRMQNTGDALASGIKATIIRAGDLTVKSLTPTIEDLDPPDESFSQPGGIKEALWTITTQQTSVPKAQDITARVEFNYLSEATKEIPVLSSSRARELYQSGKAPQSGISTNSLAPIKIQILAKDPIELGEGETQGDFTFKVYLTNEGSGVIETAATTGKCATEKLDCIDNIEISTTTKDKIKCESEGAPADWTETFKASSIKLWQGKETTITCKLKADLGSSREKQIIIKATAAYRYHYDAQTSVQIEPKR